MKNADEAIGRVLAGLRDAEAPAGMERRILKAVAARSAVPTAVGPRWARRIALAGMIAACLFIAITVIHRNGHPPTQARQRVVAHPSTGLAATEHEASLLPNQSIAPIGKLARTTAPTRKVQLISIADAVLLSEMRAPSHPAPEAPLTNEERLLLRAVHLGDPQVMAMLNPEVRARQEAESEAEFQRFIEQSGKGDPE
jgi:hypothetical protein